MSYSYEGRLWNRFGWRIWRWFGAGLLAAVLIWFALELADFDGEPGTWLIRELFHPGPKYYEFSVDLKVGGDPLTITRVIECKPYYFSPQLQFYTPAWYPARQAMTQRLKSGSGIIVMFPRLCNRDLRYRPLPTDFIPVIMWVNRADSTGEIEAYYSGNLVRSGVARVQFLAYRISEIPAPAQTDQSSEFGYWENDEYPGAVRYPRLRNFYATYAVVFPEQSWSKIPELARTLSTLENAEFLQGLANQAVDPMGIVQDADAWGLYDDYRVRVGQDDRFAEVMPFRLVDGYFEPSLRERGLIVYYSQALTFRDTDNSQATSKALTMRYRLPASTVEATLYQLPRNMFDPDSRNLYRTMYGGLRFTSSPTRRGETQ